MRCLQQQRACTGGFACSSTAVSSARRMVACWPLSGAQQQHLRTQHGLSHGLTAASAVPACQQRRPQVCCEAFAGASLQQSSGAAAPARQSLDPLAASWAGAWEAGRLLTIKSPQQFEELLQAHPEKLVVLMCKSHSCRPCKMFTRKYLSLATRFPECVLAEIFGDETPETRKLMMSLDVRVTPTFRLYRGGECVSVVTGTNEKKLMRGMLAVLSPAELVAHAQEISDTLSMDEGDAPEPAAAAAAAAAAGAGSS